MAGGAGLRAGWSGLSGARSGIFGLLSNKETLTFERHLVETRAANGWFCRVAGLGSVVIDFRVVAADGARRSGR